MAIKTFTTGEVLTASDTNTYLANAGLVFIKEQTLSGTSTNVTDCFTDTYKAYRIVLHSLQTSTNADIYFRMLSGTTPQNTGGNYYWAFTGYTSGGAANDSNGAGQDLGYTGFTQTGVNGAVIGAVSFDIYGPKLPQRTFLTITATNYTGTTFGARAGMAEHNLTTAYDGIQFLSGGASTLGGTATVYGYRTA